MRLNPAAASLSHFYAIGTISVSLIFYPRVMSNADNSKCQFEAHPRLTVRVKRRADVRLESFCKGDYARLRESRGEKLRCPSYRFTFDRIKNKRIVDRKPVAVARPINLRYIGLTEISKDERTEKGYNGQRVQSFLAQRDRPTQQVEFRAAISRRG